MNHYANCALEPHHGDIVEWVENKERWTVCREDDLEGPTALYHWPDGGWCNVNLVQRETIAFYDIPEDYRIAFTETFCAGCKGLRFGRPCEFEDRCKDFKRACVDSFLGVEVK